MKPQLITLDFETYFDKDYTLSKMTNEEYVRDPRFKVHCVGLRSDKGAATMPDLKNASALASCHIIAHHAQFDGFILSHHYNTKPAFWFDTLSMARLVHPHFKSHSLKALSDYYGLGVKTVPYDDIKGVRELSPELYEALASGCADDVELTYQLFTRLVRRVPKEELRVIDLTVRMFTEPTLLLDKPRLQAYLDKVKQAKESTLAALGVDKADLQSSSKFAELLRAQGVEPPVKPSPTDSNKLIYAFSKTDDAMKELEEHGNPTVQQLCAARLGQKSTIGETRAERLLAMSERGALPVYLNYCGAHTTRWSGGDSLNFQNFTRGSDLRLSLLAPPSCSLVVIDLSQIECRMLNWLAGQKDILDAFREGRDLYSEGASRFYNRRITKADKVERHLGKTLELGCGYGMGWSKFQLTCRKGALGGPPIILDDISAAAAVSSYRDSHSKVVEMWKMADKILADLKEGGCEYSWGPMTIEGNFIVMPNGAALDYNNIHYSREEGFYTINKRNMRSHIYGAKLVENVVQALSRVVMSQAMLKIAEQYKIVMTCHDEIVFVAPTREADSALEWATRIMKKAPDWCLGLPLDAEGGHDVRYSK